MKFDSHSWSDDELRMLVLALERSHGGYVGLTAVFGELLTELYRRKLVTVEKQARPATPNHALGCRVENA